MAPAELKDENGTVITATIQTYGDTCHTFIQNVDYAGPFLPGFSPSPYYEPFNELIDQPNFLRIDHIAGNQESLEMVPTTEWYE